MLSTSGTAIEDCWRAACSAHGIDPAARRYAYTFADTRYSDPDLVPELLDLAKAGQKRGTCHLLRDFQRNRILLRDTGDYWIVLGVQLEPHCVVRVTEVDFCPFGEVGERFAASEGEGDLSLEFWRDAHRKYFDKQCLGWGESWDERSLVVCESFELVHVAA